MAPKCTKKNLENNFSYFIDGINDCEKNDQLDGAGDGDQRVLVHVDKLYAKEDAVVSLELISLKRFNTTVQKS
jgi:hypothetical protein